MRNGARLRQVVARLPALWGALRREAREGSAVHVRSPGNLPLVSLFVLALRGGPTFIKYRGDWQGFPSEPWVWRLERRLITTRFRGSFVGVYPSGAPLAPALTPMFATTLAEADMTDAGRAADARRAGGSRLLSVSSLLPGKRVDVLIRALVSLPAEFVLRIAGGGPERQALERLVSSMGLSERVTFLGVLVPEALRREMATADLYVHASRAEGYPKSTLEAMAHGLPCVASDVAGSREILTGRGLLFPYGDSEALARQVIRVTSDDGLYGEVSRAARAYSEGQTLERLGELYRHNLEAHGIISS